MGRHKKYTRIVDNVHPSCTGLCQQFQKALDKCVECSVGQLVGFSVLIPSGKEVNVRVPPFPPLTQRPGANGSAANRA